MLKDGGPVPPVSTTHVSTSAVFGIGLLNRTARLRTVTTILLAWITTLPLGALLGAGAYLCQVVEDGCRSPRRRLLGGEAGLRGEPP